MNPNNTIGSINSNKVISNKWLVAVDGSKSAHKAFLTALTFLDKEKDELFLICVVEKITHKFGVLPSYFSTLAQAQRELEEQNKLLLNSYGHLCEENQVFSFFKKKIKKEL